MKISVLCPDLSHNCLGRAYLLAKVLQRRYKVEIVGPIFGNSIWKPVAHDQSIPYKYMTLDGRFTPYYQLYELTKEIDGDVIYASKPAFTSFGIGLFKKIAGRKPLILDSDDWEMGLIKNSFRRLSPYYRIKSTIYSMIYLYSLGSYCGTLLCEKAIRLADDITVSNNFLKSKFGGSIVWHGRDTEAFNPDRFDKAPLRAKYNFDRDEKIVMFFGTPQPYKGVEDLIEASGMIRDENVLTVLVGLNQSPYSQRLLSAGEQTLGSRFRAFGEQPFEKVPEFLAMADVVVVPQRENIATRGQVPAKIFDAMAMAKPTIATDVSDMPYILQGCGWIVKAGDIEKLSAAIQHVLKSPAEAQEMGWKARRKCIENYSWNAMERVLRTIFQKYE